MENTPGKRSKQFLLPLTPKTTPKFVIPPRWTGPVNPVRGEIDIMKGLPRDYSIGSDSDYSSCSTMLDENEMSSPVHYHPSYFDKPNDFNGQSESDPGYSLAMTLRHLPKDYTKYGFSTLSASPKTNRKESMFFSYDTNALSQPSKGRRCPNSPVKVFDSPVFAERRRNALTPSRLAALRKTHIYKDTDSSENSDDDSAEDGSRGILRSFSHTRRRSWATKPRTRRNGVNLPSQNSSDLDGYLSDQSSIEESPVLSRHGTHQQKLPAEDEDSNKKRLLALQVLHLTCARQLYGATDIGGIEICLRYDRSARRLMVLLIRGENIGSKKVLFPKQVSSFVKLNIAQCPVCQVQTSNTVKNTCDPYYDEEFAFHDISPLNLKNSYLRLQVFVEGPARKLCLKNSINIGEVRLQLTEVEQNGYIHIKEDLKLKKHFNTPKRVNIGLSYRTRDRSLTVVVVKAQNLINSIMSRGSNCCVEVKLTQVGSGGNSLDTDARHSSVRRLTTAPVFKEAFTFHLNETQNIRDGLMLVFRIVHRRPFRKNAIIGQVQFGVGSTQNSETVHWENLLRHYGRPITQWHTLV